MESMLIQSFLLIFLMIHQPLSLLLSASLILAFEFHIPRLLMLVLLLGSNINQLTDTSFLFLFFVGLFQQ